MTTQKLPRVQPTIAAGSLQHLTGTGGSSLRFQLLAANGELVFDGELGENLQDFLRRVEALVVPTNLTTTELSISCKFESAPSDGGMTRRRRNQDWVEDAA